ncbi:MAG TPA: penicillin-binding protein 1C [bacterium]|nr:penicillin-binding protein 1C [bacterium]HQL61604.1 penicillin-binding protein 1C [bacterium]
MNNYRESVCRVLQGWAAICKLAGVHRRVVLCVSALVLFGIICLSWPPDKEYYRVTDVSPELRDRHGNLLYCYLNANDSWCVERGIEEISPRLIQATVSTEDQRFYSHIGVDPFAIVRALVQDIVHHRVVSGASTIPMQVVKMTCAAHNRSCSKVYQAVEAIRLSLHFSRNDILEMYLNRAPYGGNLIGCEAASRRYFGKPAGELTIAEAALLAGLPKAPGYYSPLNHPSRALARRNYVLRRMHEEGYIDRKELLGVREQPIQVRYSQFPQHSPHLAMRVKGTIRAGSPMTVTLDGAIQEKCEEILRRSVRNLGNGVENAAAMVVDVETAEVLARVGSAGFYDVPGGQVDLCDAPRSPGSALKPFLYALAMERNSLYASETLIDDTWDVGLYRPENFNRYYNGTISAGYALRKSLNVPAVSVQRRIGTAAFLSHLKDIGFTTLTKSADYYGLGLTLGSCEVKLEEAIAAYCTIANLGVYRPLRTIRDSSRDGERRIYSAGICLMLYQMLEQPLPSELDRDMNAVHSPSRVCWKTGTSWGLRDAWAFVWNTHYVVGVWVGNNDARSSELLVGARAALPPAGKIFRSLPLKTTSEWPETGGELHEVLVCAASGLPASQWCKNTRTVYLPRTQYLHRTCKMHQPMSGKEGVKIVERRPASPSQWDLAAVQIPVRLHSCVPVYARQIDLEILEPSDGAEYVLTGEPDGDRIRLRASVENSPLHWYLDDQYIGDTGPDRGMYIDLQAGAHRLTCMSLEGETETVHFVVSLPGSRPALAVSE